MFCQLTRLLNLMSFNLTLELSYNNLLSTTVVKAAAVICNDVLSAVLQWDMTRGNH